jgi:hypothetical protein
MALSDNTRRKDPWDDWRGVPQDEVLSASLQVTARCFERGHVLCQQRCRTSPVHLASEGLITSAAGGVPTARFTQLLATVGDLDKPTVQNCLREGRTCLSGEQIQLFIKAVEQRKAESLRRGTRDSSSHTPDDTSSSSRTTGERATEGDAAGRHLLGELALEGLGDRGEAAGGRGADGGPGHPTGPPPTTDWSGLEGRLRISRYDTDRLLQRGLQRAPGENGQDESSAASVRGPTNTGRRPARTGARTGRTTKQ